VSGSGDAAVPGQPVQLVRRTSANGIAKNRFIRVEKGELLQEFLRLSQGVGLFEDHVAATGACHRGDELNDGLMRQAQESSRMPRLRIPVATRCLAAKPVVEGTDQDVGINERGHRVEVLSLPSAVARRLGGSCQPTLAVAFGGLIEPTEPRLPAWGSRLFA
jgi:hypothetical protein